MSESKTKRRCPLCAPDDPTAVRPARGIVAHLVQGHGKTWDEAREIAEAAEIVQEDVDWLTWTRQVRDLNEHIAWLQAQQAEGDPGDRRFVDALDEAHRQRKLLLEQKP